jgi:hypothetical protein
LPILLGEKLAQIGSWLENLESPTTPNVSPEDREILEARGYIE